MFDVDIIYTADSFIDSLTVLLTAEITIWNKHKFKIRT